jgi:hypothetical protein
MCATNSQWNHKIKLYYEREDEVKDVELMDKRTTTILYDDTLYANVELYLYMAEKQYEDDINILLCAYGYMTMSDMVIRIRNYKQKDSSFLVLHKQFEINVLHNTTNSVVNNIKAFVDDAYEFFSENIINNTNIVLFQAKFLVKTRILFNLPVLYTVCSRIKLL